MEIEITYKAWNGMEFKDPYACEQYEKTLAKFPGTVAYLLEHIEQFKDTDLFTGTLMYKEKGKHTVYFTRTNIDFSDLYEGEMVTQAMMDAQMRVTNTVGDVRRHFSKMDPGTPCGGTFIIQKNPSSLVAASYIDCSSVFEAARKDNC